MIETIRLPYEIPYYSQLASPELASPIFDSGMDSAQDPLWREYGARSQEEYAYWASRACGAACVKMVVEGLGGPVRSMMDWIQRGVALGGYLTTSDVTGLPAEIGWSHTVLARLVEQAGFPARSQPASIDVLIDHLRQGFPAIVSISYELGTDRAVSQKGGHLSVLTGADVDAGGLVAVTLHNPSGRTSALRQHAHIPASRFERAYSGRAILVFGEKSMSSFQIGAHALIFDESGKVLLVHRRDYDAWDLPGGSVESGETPWDGAVREVKEETGLDVRIQRLDGIYSEPSRNTLVFSFICIPTGGSLALNPEADALDYFPIDQLPENTLPRKIDRIHDALTPHTEPYLKIAQGPTLLDLAAMGLIRKTSQPWDDASLPGNR